MRDTSDHEAPNWDALYATAEAQAGHFTTAQANEAGYSLPLLHKYLTSGRITRVRRGIYRLVHFPSTEHEALVVFWLWAKQAGFFSHETALALHDLSDVLPARTHITVPASWGRRRLRIPDGLVLHYGDTDERDRDWLDSVPITSAMRTIRDCIDTHVTPDLIGQAIGEARHRGLISSNGESELVQELELSHRNPS